MAYQHSIPVDFADIAKLRQNHLETRMEAGRRRNAQMQPIPTESRIRVVALRTPGPVWQNVLPATLTSRVVDGRLCPVQVIANMELPWSVELRGPFPKTVDAHDLRWFQFLRCSVAGRKPHGQPYQEVEKGNESRAHLVEHSRMRRHSRTSAMDAGPGAPCDSHLFGSIHLTWPLSGVDTQPDVAFSVPPD